MEQIPQPPAERSARFRRKGETPGGSLRVNELLQFYLHLSRRQILESGSMFLDVPNECISKGRLFSNLDDGATMPVDVIRDRRRCVFLHPGDEMSAGGESDTAGEKRAQSRRLARGQVAEKGVAVAIN